MSGERTGRHADPAPAAGGLREAFLRALTVDCATHDRRRKDFNQAIFDPRDGYAIWDRTDLDMVMDAFDKAVRLAASGEADG